MRDQVDFLFAEKHQSSLQVSTIAFWWVWLGMPKVSKIASL